MNLFSRKYLINADIDHVIRCFTDLETVARAISDMELDARMKAVVKSDGLYLAAEEPIMKTSPFTVDSSGIYSARIMLIPEQLKRLGDAAVGCYFISNQAGTSVVTTVESEKSPNLLWRMFVKLIVWVLAFQSRSKEKKYIQWIEKTA